MDNLHTVYDYLNDLASDLPAPGGGSAAAFSGASGTALILMAARITLKNQKYEQFHSVCRNVEQQLAPLMSSLSEASDKDINAYNALCAAYKLPRETDEQKSTRTAEIQNRTLEATAVPLQAMRLANECLTLAEKLIENLNPNIISDLGAGVALLFGCVQCCKLNVLVNLKSLADTFLREKLSAEMQALYDNSEKLYKKIYNWVKKSL